jgi:hypothetical protein
MFLAFLAAFLAAAVIVFLAIMITGETMIFGDAEIHVGEVTTESPPPRR